MRNLIVNFIICKFKDMMINFIYTDSNGGTCGVVPVSSSQHSTNPSVVKLDSDIDSNLIICPASN